LARRRGDPDGVVRRDELTEMVGVHLTRQKRALEGADDIRLRQALKL
jgi:hypothetical protein